jgi:hypothetical protein
MNFNEWWATLTPSEQKLIGRTNAKFVWMEACEACVGAIKNQIMWDLDDPEATAIKAIQAKEQA